MLDSQHGEILIHPIFFSNFLFKFLSLQSLEKHHFLFCHWRAATNCNTIPEYHLQISSAASPVGIANVRWTPSSAATPRTWRSCARAATPSPTRWPASGAPCPGETPSSFSAPPPSCQERAIPERTVPGVKLVKYLCASWWFIYVGATEKYSTTSECQRRGKPITRGEELKHEATKAKLSRCATCKNCEKNIGTKDILNGQ